MKHEMWGGAGKDNSSRILSYYSYLFGFPSHRVLILLLVVTTLGGGALCFTVYEGLSRVGSGLVFGLFALLIPCLISDLLTTFVLWKDPLMTPRRSTALSVMISSVFVLLLMISALAARLGSNADWIAKSFMIGICLSVGVRFLVLTGLTSRSFGRVLPLSWIQPLLSVMCAVVVLPVTRNVLFAGLLGGLGSFCGAWLVVNAVRHSALVEGSFDPLELFRAFLLAWAGGISGPLESYLEKRGEDKDLCVDRLVFNAEKRCKGVLVIPHIHSGPFRNTGSGELPAMVTRELEARFSGVVLLTHGISTHEQDLASRKQSEKVVEALLEHKGPNERIAEASTLVRRNEGLASATCQIFGGLALVTLTVSPRSFDDLPHVLEERILGVGRSMGLEIAVVDLHNSIDSDIDLTEGDYSDLYRAAVEAIKEAAASPRQLFKVGFSSAVPSEFTLVDGMGPAGFGAFAVQVGSQTSVLAVVDGNNMVSGLREDVISSLKEKGFHESEIATSDTHIVNGLSASARGYYAIGERVDRASVVSYVTQVASKARAELEAASLQYVRVKVQGLRVIGEGGLRFLGDVLEASFKQFKRSVIFRFLPILLLFLILLLLV